MSLLFVGEMTDRMSYLVAALQHSCIQTTLLDDVVTANEVLGASKSYRIVLIGADISHADAIYLIRQVREMQRRLPVIAMYTLICANHPKPHCLQPLMNKTAKACDAINAAEIIILMMHGKISGDSLHDYIERLRMIVDVAGAKVDSLISRRRLLGSTGTLDSDGFNRLYLDLLLLKELNDILLSEAHDVSSFS